MKKNIAIVALSVALGACLIQLDNNALTAGAMRVAQRKVRLAGFEVWSGACQRAAAGSQERVKWCASAERETMISAAHEGVTNSDSVAAVVKQVYATPLSKW